MKFDHLKKFLGILIVAISLFSFPINPPTAVAYQFGIELQISKNPSFEFSNGPITVPEGDPLFFRGVISAYTETVQVRVNQILSSFLTSPITDVLTYTLTPGQQVILNLWGQIEQKPMRALLGTNTEWITVTGVVNPPFTISDSVMYTGISSVIPEPATLLLIGSGLLGLAGLRKKLKK